MTDADIGDGPRNAFKILRLDAKGESFVTSPWKDGLVDLGIFISYRVFVWSHIHGGITRCNAFHRLGCPVFMA